MSVEQKIDVLCDKINAMHCEFSEFRAEQTQRCLDATSLRIQHERMLRGESGSNGLCGRVANLEFRSKLMWGVCALIGSTAGALMIETVCRHFLK